ncbi:MAG: hypothetical protein JWN40_1583 [Phycisphaerales bacterium]|nr:hypothetical protein [Phycisphaerales bacterium]
MSQGMHSQAEIVQRAIAAFRSEANASEIAELDDEQLAAGSSGLEWYGRTAGVFERFLVSHSVSHETRGALEQAIHAVRVIFGSAT